VLTDDAGTHPWPPTTPGHSASQRRTRVATGWRAQQAGFIPYAPELGGSPIEWITRPDRRVLGVVSTPQAIDYTGVVLSASGAGTGRRARIVAIPGGEQTLECCPTASPPTRAASSGSTHRTWPCSGDRAGSRHRPGRARQPG
jgi:hypothetical protein